MKRIVLHLKFCVFTSQRHITVVIVKSLKESSTDGTVYQKSTLTPTQ